MVTLICKEKIVRKTNELFVCCVFLKRIAKITTNIAEKIISNENLLKTSLSKKKRIGCIRLLLIGDCTKCLSTMPFRL
jgi:hypothetical protein